MPRGRPRKRPLTPVSASDSEALEYEQIVVKDIYEPNDNEHQPHSDPDWMTEEDDITQEEDDEQAGKRSGVLDFEWRATRAVDVFATCDEPKPPLILPTGSEDLNVDTAHVLEALGVYETVRRFSVRLRLTPFQFEGTFRILVTEFEFEFESDIELLGLLFTRLSSCQIF